MWTNEGGYHLENDLAKFQPVGFDSSIAKLLRSQPDITEKVIRKICEEVTYADLSALTTEDLKLFGVDDENKKSQLVTDFAELSNQEKSLKDFVSGLDANSYQKKIYCHVQNQLNAIALILEAVDQHTGPDWNNILVKPNVHISTVLLRALEKLSENSFAMRMTKRSNQFKWICGGAILGLAMVPLLFAARKLMQAGNFFVIYHE